MDTRHVSRAELAGRPWPEALAGAVVGAMLVMATAFVPQVSRYIDVGSPTLLPLLIAGAILGASVSWFAAKPELERLAGRRPTIMEQRYRRAA